MLFAYVTQVVIYLPFLRRHLEIEVLDLVAQLWLIVPALLAGYGATLLVPSSLGDCLPTLAVRALFTALVVAFVHGPCTRFRCFQEAIGMIFENLARVRA